MVATLNAALARLDTGTYLRIPDPAGRTLAVLNGLVWVTQDGDPRDAFIASGETFEFNRPGLAIVEAMSETRLAVYAAHGVTEQSALV
jgi:hypothetical protein